MYCVVQEIKLKKPNMYGYPKRLEAYFLEMSFNGKDMSHYCHRFSDERFERPIKKAYKISIHQSYRADGKVKKKQYVLCTVNYYDFATGMMSLYEFCESGIITVASKLGIEDGIIYEMVEKKLNPLIESIRDEFMQTEEYKVNKKHEDITTRYALNKIEFGKNYECDSSIYDSIYDVFGNLMNETKLEEVKANFEVRKEYEEKSRSYQEDFHSNYSKYFKGSGGGSYFNNNQSNHDTKDKEMLKQFYRVLSKKFHPDANPDKDTSKEMKLLNRLKNDWDI